MPEYSSSTCWNISIASSHKFSDYHLVSDERVVLLFPSCAIDLFQKKKKTLPSLIRIFFCVLVTSRRVASKGEGEKQKRRAEIAIGADNFIVREHERLHVKRGRRGMTNIDVASSRTTPTFAQRFRDWGGATGYDIVFLLFRRSFKEIGWQFVGVSTCFT